jgi:hypothetical protein
MRTPNDYHDAYVTGIIIDENNIIIHTKKNSSYQNIILKEVSSFRADAFLKGNIILNISIKNVVDIDKEVIIEDLHLLYSEGFISDASIEGYYRDGKMFFELIPSYGCEIIAVCSSILLE